MAGWLERRRRLHAVALPERLSRRRELLERLSAVRSLDGPESAPEPLLRVLASVLDLLRAADLRHGVRLSTVTLPGRGGALLEGLPDTQSIDSLARTVQDWGGLRMLRLDVRASYRDYAGLKACCAELRELPLAFRRLLIEEDRIQFSLSLFGR